MKTELLAPAGDLDAAYAAFHYGADAVYLGLQRFSARAEAANFSPEDLSEIVGFAHSTSPRRSVFVAFNTLIQDQEQDEAIETLEFLDATGVDAVIVQDLGIARLARTYFPQLELHASTQLVIHNVAGAIAARELGFKRVTLARELTLKEMADIVREGGVDVEVFIHGALCYSYSGLCLYSSMLRGRSGNRGRCAYPCRDTFGQAKVYPFSMKDLALTGDVLKLREAGVFSFKIEGRKKSALYVAAVTQYYRKLLAGSLTVIEKRTAEEEIKTIFSRPWTELYLNSSRNREVTDVEVVGHRGAPIGIVEKVIQRGGGKWVQFKTQRRLERHDGIQTDVPGRGRPFGFPVDHLRKLSERWKPLEEVFEVHANCFVEVGLPQEHPEIKTGAPLYCSSSQTVKQQYRFPRPKPGLHRVRIAMHVVINASADELEVIATLAACAGLSAKASMPGPFVTSRDADMVTKAVQAAFSKLGNTQFELGDLAVNNPDSLFIPVSVLNRLRREVASQLSESVASRRGQAVQTVQVAEKPVNVQAPTKGAALRWSLKSDRIAHLSELEEADWQGLDEVVIEIQRDPLPELRAGLVQWRERVGANRIRLALPVLMREWERSDLEAKIKVLKAEGWARWEAAALFAWPLLGKSCSGAPDSADGELLTTDWSVYVSNRSAARQVLAMGASRFTLSPEDGNENMHLLLKQYGEYATVIVYQDTPLFISENCALAAQAARCPASPDCRSSEREWESGSGEAVRMIQHGCRTLAINEVPFSLAGRLRELQKAGARYVRADFINRRYEPAKVCEVWRTLRQDHRVAGYEGNYSRGVK
ncbi:MAG: U32 family peptidase [bacterium]|jgi:putative protease